MRERLDLKYPGLGNRTEQAIKSRVNGRKEDYDDSYRAYITGDKVGKALYDYVKRLGCCGYYDGVMTPKKGIDVNVGYNYGH